MYPKTFPNWKASLFKKILLGRWKAASGDGGMETVSLAGSEERLPNLDHPGSFSKQHWVARSVCIRLFRPPVGIPWGTYGPGAGATGTGSMPLVLRAKRKGDGNMQFHCFLDTKRCQSTNIFPCRPCQKVHLALAAFLHWAPLQVHQKALKQPNLVALSYWSGWNSVGTIRWEIVDSWPKACPKTSPPKESPMVYRRSW